jgi:uncharacterized repeat protein (TIGR03847 family)
VNPSFDLPRVDRLTTGTVGAPGERVFYLQARRGAQVVTLKLEKVQVAALAQYLAQRLSDLPAPDHAGVTEDPDVLELEAPIDPEWTVGAIGVTYDEDVDRIVIVTEELPDEPDEEADEVMLGEHPDRGVARFAITREQAASFVVRAAAVVSRGRPPCRLCGRPLDAEGHVCVKGNGHSPR